MMLERLIQAIRAGGTLEAHALAARLGTSPAMVQAMLEHLQRLGMIQPYTSDCSDGCQACTLSSACSAAARAEKIQLWQYTGQTI